MKKHLLVLGMIICMLGLTACGSSKADDTSYLSTEDALSCAEYYFDGLSQMSSEQLEEAEKQGYDVSVFKSAYSSYESSIDEIGVVTGMGELKQNTMDADMTEGTILAVVEGTDHNATGEECVNQSYCKYRLYLWRKHGEGCTEYTSRYGNRILCFNSDQSFNQLL